MTNRILYVAPSFWPATFWGGPIHSTKAICDGIANLPSFEVAVLTTDAAGLEASCRVTSPPQMAYPVSRGRRIAGHSIAPGLVAKLPAALRDADLVHLTGTYSFPTLWTLLLARLFNRPVVWSLRGAVQATEEWPDAPNRTAKRRFEDMSRRLAPERTVLHVTSKDEEQVSARRLPGLSTALIPNAVDIPDTTDAREWRPGGRFRLLFLSRLHEKKGIDLLIDVVRDMPQHVELEICGTGAPAYVAFLRERAGGDPRVRFVGEVSGEAKARAFAGADLFVLPSHSENFGIAVAEALGHGVPVLTTTRTPWTELDTRAAGRCIDLSPETLRTALEELADAPLREMGARGRAWMLEAYSSNVMVQRFAELYLSLMACGGSR